MPVLRRQNKLSGTLFSAAISATNLERNLVRTANPLQVRRNTASLSETEGLARFLILARIAETKGSACRHKGNQNC